MSQPFNAICSASTNRRRRPSPGCSPTSSSIGRSTTPSPTPSATTCKDTIAVGKRVRAPSAAATAPTVGYCVRLSETPPARPVKELVGVLDDEALLDDHLMRLTRWMADYYLCGWGQVLNAVVPAGARDQAGTRQRAFVEAVPGAELPPPLPT